MRIVDVLSAPWAIVPEKLEEILAIYQTHLRGEKIDLEALEAKLGRPLSSEQKPYVVRDGVAILGVEGVIAKRMNLFTRISGGVSTQLLERDFKAAMADGDVRSILLAVDSPGGTVDGTQQLAQAIYGARGTKPITALADGLMASAAYWIGSAADRILIASDTTQVGSIGVIATHVDYSRQDEKAGIKITEITAGKYKAANSPNAPLSETGRAVIQSTVDHIYSVFVDAVAMHRGKDAATVLKDMADGRIFIGRKALAAGLVDGVATFEQALELAAKGNTAAVTVGAVAPNPTHAEEEEMKEVMIGSVTCTTQEEINAAFTAAIAQATSAGATAELQRIQSVEANALPGHDDLVKAAKFDGKTTGEQLAAQIVQAEKARIAQAKTDLKTDAPAAAPNAPAPPSTEHQPKNETRSPQQIATEAQKYQDAQAKAGQVISTADAVKHVSEQQAAE